MPAGSAGSRRVKKPQAVIFDVFGTCVDWRSGVADEVRTFFAAKSVEVEPIGFADAWRAEYQPAMKVIRSGDRGYVDLDVLHRENLDRVLAATGLFEALDAQERDTLNHAWEKLPAWPDVVKGLDAMRSHAIIAPCSNGSIALMTRLARYAGLPWDCILGAPIARNYKPEPVVYLASCTALRLEPAEVLMVAAHNDDLAAARAAGLMTAFVARPTEHGVEQKTDLAPASDWDFVAEDFVALARALFD